MRIVVSDCLRGVACRYDGGSKPSGAVLSLCEKTEALGVCPEREAGLPVPRPPAEQRDGGVWSADGINLTSAFASGARACLDEALAHGAPLAVLKEKSPSCGSTCVYDGTYTGRLVKGAGVYARLLREEGICVVSEDMVKACKPSVEHPVAIVLGTGLGHLASLVRPVRRIDYHDIEGFPAEARPMEGHSFEATIGSVDDVPVIVYPGRIHLYQGYSAAEVSALVRHAHRLGARDIVFACATGAIEGNAHTGLGIISDQINLTGRNPLAEWDEIRDVASPFVDMTDAYSPYLRTLARGVADDAGIAVEEGVYAGVLGPCLETQAEVAMMRQMGVSYVGMSLACETIMARTLGMNVLGLTLATNMAGDGATHDKVAEVAAEHAGDFERLVRGVLRLL